MKCSALLSVGRLPANYSSAMKLHEASFRILITLFPVYYYNRHPIVDLYLYLPPYESTISTAAVESLTSFYMQHKQKIDGFAYRAGREQGVVQLPCSTSRTICKYVLENGWQSCSLESGSPTYTIHVLTDRVSCLHCSHFSCKMSICVVVSSARLLLGRSSRERVLGYPAYPFDRYCKTCQDNHSNKATPASEDHCNQHQGMLFPVK